MKEGQQKWKRFAWHSFPKCTACAWKAPSERQEGIPPAHANAKYKLNFFITSNDGISVKPLQEIFKLTQLHPDEPP